MFGLSRLRAIEIGIALVLTLAALLLFGFRAGAEKTAGQGTTRAASMAVTSQSAAHH